MHNLTNRDIELVDLIFIDLYINKNTSPEYFSRQYNISESKFQSLKNYLCEFGELNELFTIQTQPSGNKSIVRFDRLKCDRFIAAGGIKGYYENEISSPGIDYKNELEILRILKEKSKEIVIYSDLKKMVSSPDDLDIILRSLAYKYQIIINDLGIGAKSYEIATSGQIRLAHAFREHLENEPAIEAIAITNAVNNVYHTNINENKGQIFQGSEVKNPKIINRNSEKESKFWKYVIEILIGVIIIYLGYRFGWNSPAGN